MIIVKDLHKTFENNHVLRGVNYHVHQGEKIVVIDLPVPEKVPFCAA